MDVEVEDGTSPGMDPDIGHAFRGRQHLDFYAWRVGHHRGEAAAAREAPGRPTDENLERPFT